MQKAFPGGGCGQGLVGAPLTTIPFNPALLHRHPLSKALDEEYLMRLSDFAYLPDIKLTLFDFSPSTQRDADAT